MKRPSKKEIQAAVAKLRDPKTASFGPDQYIPRVDGRKSNKNRIRKQGA